MSNEPKVLISRENGALIFTLNRPKALNALDLDMIRVMKPELDQAATDPAIKLVIIRGTGGRAFCAGGDVRAVAIASREPGNGLPEAFFSEEYALNLAIHNFPKPYVALVEGISMGGGMGLSAHGSHRVVSDKLVFAMPETGIGLYPDVGGTWVLTRFPGATGMYAGLTGARFGAADAAYFGYATQVVAHEQMDAVERALIAAAPGDAAAVDAVLAPFVIDPGVAPVAEQREAIDRIFSLPSLAAIEAALAAEPGDWASAIVTELAKKSPTALALVFEQLTQGKGLTIEAVFALELKLSLWCIDKDFYEGIRALLIDKDNQPNWTPARLEDVDVAAIHALFA